MRAAEERKLFLACGAAGLIGSLGVIIGNLVGIMVYEKHDPISETISALAVGKYSWILDSSLCLFAVGLLACATGLYRWSLDGAKWKTASVLLGLLSMDIVIIALYNQYAGTQHPGMKVHLYAVYTLGVLVSLTAFLLVSGLQEIEITRSWGKYSVWFGVSWTILAPPFFFVSTAWEGAYERMLGLMLVSWVALLSWLVLQHGRKGMVLGR
ncbi:DUF998 domain-containing protein [Halomonas sp. McH1-25]|uniref:DUF998 domain-containing protein n=1 Tax=unclassified Halomonas TaxID=2609666 RepID=UPI001EF51C46|nr:MULTISPECIES: DUF998 domain-containing protein [unclassified Halomonas]MCG7600119.1 DUF998 domain-containing protein [Halomonas sp. McH1-25]MCP1341368.1 DUF998 domain-containing protein [Halomonas sp. FL8]MCP1359687.1 DUF998 domain-containing protein [Halomonas sp. BBD45]MCP1364261.1 DUF998 domain-containing protein [Halomonas sp. BBD48]